jgi:hypothetical protein
MSNKQRPVSIYGVIYKSISKASTAIGEGIKVVKRKLDSQKYTNYSFIELDDVILSIEDLILSNGKINPNIKIILSNNIHLVDEILNLTKELPSTFFKGGVEYDYSLTDRVRIINNGCVFPTCEECGIAIKFGNIFCSSKCRSLNSNQQSIRNNTGIDKYGTSRNSDKIKSTTFCRYGTENIGTISHIQDKIKSTRKEKYGSYWNEEHHKKSKSTKIDKYGSIENYRLSVVKSTYVTKYTIDKTLLDKCVFLEQYPNNELPDNVINYLSISYGIYSPPDKLLYRSRQEQEISDFLSDLGVKFETTRKVINPYELDFYIPSHNLAIEFNGLYWHSSGCVEDDSKWSKQHLLKTNMCEGQGIQLFHIFENEWEEPNKREIWKSMIRNKLGLSKRIYARKCKFVVVSSKDSKMFCIENHIQGNVNASSKIGLMYNGELVSLMTFGIARYTEGIELLRSCTKSGYVVVGGFSKLLKHSSYDKIISYANRRLSMGNVYNSNGFLLDSVTKPSYYYWDGKRSLVLNNRVQFQKHKLSKLLDVFNPELTEYENMYMNGYRRIWDCGNIKYVYERIKKAD